MKNDLIPSDIHRVYEPLFHDVCHLHRKWKLFCDLYAAGEKVIELLNESAPGFFRICQDSLRDDILLGICRLTDQKQTFGKDNLTLDSLVASIDTAEYSELRKTLERLFSDARLKSTFARDQRNKRIAHTDLFTKLEVSILSVSTKKHIEEALQSIRDVMNAVELHFNTPVYVDDANVAYVEYLSRWYVDARQLITRLQSSEPSSEYDFDYTKAKPNRFAGRIAKTRV